MGAASDLTLRRRTAISDQDNPRSSSPKATPLSASMVSAIYSASSSGELNEKSDDVSCLIGLCAGRCHCFRKTITVLLDECACRIDHALTGAKVLGQCDLFYIGITVGKFLRYSEHRYRATGRWSDRHRQRRRCLRRVCIVRARWLLEWG